MSLGIPKRWGTRVREAPCHLLRCLFSLAHSDLASECGVLLLLREAGLTPQVPVASSAIVLSSQDDSLPKGTRGSPPQGPPSPREPDSLSVFSLSFDQQLQPILLCVVPSPQTGRGGSFAQASFLNFSLSSQPAGSHRRGCLRD